MNQGEHDLDTRDRHAQRVVNEGQKETPAVSRSQSAVSGDELSVAGAPDADAPTADPLDPTFLSYDSTAAKAQFGHYSRGFAKKDDSRDRDPRREPLTQAQGRAAASNSNEPNERQASPTSVEPVAGKSGLVRVGVQMKPQSVAAPTSSVPVLFVADDPDEPMKQRIVDAIARRAPSRLEAVLRTLSDASQWDPTSLSAYLAAVRDVLGGIDGRPELTDAEVEDNVAAMRAMRPRLAVPSSPSLPPQSHLLNSQCLNNDDDDITTAARGVGGVGGTNTAQNAQKPKRDKSSRVLDGRLEAPEHPATFFVEYPNPDSAFADHPIAAEEFVLRSPPSSSAGALHMDPRSHQNALPRGSYSERAQDNAMPVRLPEHISMRSTHTAATGERASRQDFHRSSPRGQPRPGEKRRQPVSSAAQHVVTTPPSTADTSRDFLEPFPHQRRVGGPDVITHLHDQSDCGDPQVSQLARTMDVRGATTALQELSWTDDSTVNAAAVGLERQAAAELEFVQQQDAALRYAAPELATADAGLVASQRTAASYRSDTDPNVLRRPAPRSFGLEPGAGDHLGAAIPDEFGRIGAVSLPQPRRIGNDGAGALRAMRLQRSLPEDRGRTFV